MQRQAKIWIRTAQYRMEKAAETDSAATAILEAERDASRAKTERLRALRAEMKQSAAASSAAVSSGVVESKQQP